MTFHDRYNISDRLHGNTKFTFLGRKKYSCQSAEKQITGAAIAINKAQGLTCLKPSGLSLGLLLNFDATVWMLA
jgi:hypothetical protein